MKSYTINELKSLYGENDVQVKELLKAFPDECNRSIPAFRRLELCECGGTMRKVRIKEYDYMPFTWKLQCYKCLEYRSINA